MLKQPIEIFIRRLKQVLSVALHDTGSQRVQWRRPSTCCFSASFVWLHAPSAGLLMMTNVSRLLVEVCSHKKPGAHRVMRFSGARQSVSSASNVQVFQSLDWVETWSLFTKANRCVSYWYLWHYFYLQEVSLLGSIHLEETVVFYVFVFFQKLTCIHRHNNTAAHVRMCFMGQCQCLSGIYLFFIIPTA